MFGKYRLLHILGTGRTGTVWLAEHLGLEEYRAVKCVSRTNGDYETFRREALILKELRHPGIPMIYDIEEDGQYFYLIEEYLKGDSLYTLITCQGTLREADAVRYGMQICGLVEYLHSAGEYPILYLDLQPHNLIISEGTVRLIDFDHAAESPEANQSRSRYGTIGCAAPEQYTTDQMLDQRTDIYAIGAVLRFMTEGTLMQGAESRADLTGAFIRIIRKCMDPDREKRYSTAKEAGCALERLCVRELPVKKESKAVPSLNVVLTGSRPGAGTTHLAFGLCRYLTSQGYKVLYEEHNPSQAVRTLAQLSNLRSDHYGIYHVHRCCMKPWYGPAVCLREPEGFQVVLKDCGTDWRLAKAELMKGGRVLLAAATGSLWEKEHVERMAETLKKQSNEESMKIFLLFRHMSGGRFKLLGHGERINGFTRRHSGTEVFGMPEFTDPFCLSVEAEFFLKTVWESAAGNSGRKDGIKGWTEKIGADWAAFLTAVKTLLTYIES